ncbi:Leucine rich repeat [Carpediemonas membranifera]|uniref:Leucine rich repeat n=1 Tax=Carpediemonas membranifera TaxID=201153 RepID=A0A8J6BB53_9EUKA|nr:Leucine rich repeat [Carpediemonas membranifera]|eukprot:KAG9396602.1 Leucine rich repeat [Carpediemonas membranifera]
MNRGRFGGGAIGTGVQIFAPDPSARVEGACKRARHSGELIISNCDLIDLPPFVYNINEEDFGEKWFELVGITKIIARDNKLVELTDDISRWLELSVLDLSNNMLLSFPKAVEALAELRALKLDGNRLTDLPDVLDRLPVLALLTLSRNSLAALPSSITRCLALASLDVSNNRLARVPPGTGALWTNLIHLDLSHNMLDDLSEMKPIPSLETINLSFNRLMALPDFLGQCTKLHTVEAEHNSIRFVPAMPEALTELRMGNNQLSGLPESLLECRKLSVLVVSDNSIESLPDDIDRLSSLTTLDVHNNSLRSLPPRLGLLQGTLVRLSAEGNQLKDLKHAVLQKGAVAVLDLLRTRMDVEDDEPQAAVHAETLGASGRLVVSPGPTVFPQRSMRGRADLDGVTAVIANGCGLESIDDELLAELFPSLQTLELGDNKLTEMPALHRIATLKTVVLRKNRLTAVPETLAQCRNLEHLDLSVNKISNYSVPETVFARLPLRHLDMSYNALKTFPFEARGVPPRLETLIVANNHIADFPTELGESFVKVGLQVLDIANNDMSTIPPVMGRCPLTQFQVEGNILRRLRQAIITQGTEAILKWLRMQM